MKANSNPTRPIPMKQKQKKYFIILSVFMMFVTLVKAQPKLVEKITKQANELVIPYEKYKLPNGLTIVIHEDAFTFSEPKKTEAEWHYQKKRHLSTGTHYKIKHKILLSLYAASHFFCWMSLIACIVFPKFIMFTAILFVLRWLVQWFVFQKSFTLLKSQHLINYIWLFDIWLLYYNIKSLPLLFIKSKLHWK